MFYCMVSPTDPITHCADVSAIQKLLLLAPRCAVVETIAMWCGVVHHVARLDMVFQQTSMRLPVLPRSFLWLVAYWCMHQQLPSRY